MPNAKLDNPGYYKAKPQVAVFDAGGFGFQIATTEHVPTHILTEHYPKLSWLDKEKYDTITGLLGDMDNAEHFYLVFNADCAFPPTYIVCADSSNDALDIFIDETDSCKINETDIVDYKDDDMVHNSDGDYQDISQVQIIEVKLHTLLY
jgi:hypothetical protein